MNQMPEGYKEQHDLPCCYTCRGFAMIGNSLEHLTYACLYHKTAQYTPVVSLTGICNDYELEDI